MPLLKDGTHTENQYKVLSAEEATDALPPGDYLFPVSHIELALQFQAEGHGKSGLWLDSSDEPRISTDLLNQFTVVAVNFPKFIDGRGYSIAFLLRERLGFNGDIRAIGDVLVDQLNYMRRCGFSSFELREDQDVEVAVREMNGFTNFYQTSADEAIPAYRLRHNL
ncbi:DUF934 domain-containing protein [uncultured Endozoicomonas sp.]|uniref:DUF934 domain-containing protein n=1 Tax=uncultured Endozoicomonas sp. TaxID=432652 RepID=UPI00260A81E9|nr:DUF934 domain-containing protein [uncultured Endozoicomonas sp.]